MKMIVAADRNWAIGNKGELLVSIPSDQKMFRQETTGKTVVYGRKTMDTFPGKQPLPGRRNIILSRIKKYKVRGAEVVSSIRTLLKTVDPEEEVYIIGGGSVYRQMLPYCDEVKVTKIDKVFESDCYFPDLDKDPEWEQVESSEEQTYFDLEYYFQRYVRVLP